MDKSVKLETNSKKRENIANLDKLSKGKKVAKQKSAIDLLEEEEAITQYGKGRVEAPIIVSESGKQLTEGQAEFVEKNGLSKDCVEYIMTFMG